MSLALLLLFLLSPVWVALLLPLTLAVAADGQKEEMDTARQCYAAT
jgi:hypothetical protein